MSKIVPFYQIISCFFFALLGLQIKLQLKESSIEDIVFHRSLFGTLILFFFLIFRKGNIKEVFKTKNFNIHLIRSIFGILAMFFGYKSLIYLSLAQASTIGFTKVFFTCIISSIIFMEKIRISIFFSIIFGFLGIFLITNPDQINSKLGLYMSLFSALCVSGGIISISYLSKKDKTITILLYHSIMSTIIFFTIFNNKINLTLSDITIKYILLTFTALAGQFFNTESYKNDKTQKVVILSYSRIIFSTIFGFFFFNDKISLINLFGVFIVILTTFFVQKK